MLHFQADGREVIALLGANTSELGKAVLSFTSGIEHKWIWARAAAGKGADDQAENP